MITTVTNDRCQLLYGLSTNEKPINKYIGNGSEFIELDTGNIYLFDEENEKWLKFNHKGGDN